MAILKLNRKMSKIILNNKIINISILFGSAVFLMMTGYYNQKNENSTKTQECKEDFFVAQNMYWVYCDEYNLEDISHLSAKIIRKGKIIKIFSKPNLKSKFYSFEYNNLMKSDTILIAIKEDIYYIHEFQNDYWLGYKPNKCFLDSYKINETVYKEIREANYGDKYSNSSPRKKEFHLTRKDLKEEQNPDLKLNKQTPKSQKSF